MSRSDPPVSTETWTALVRRGYDHARPVIRFGDLRWTGREFLDRAAGAADWLDALDLSPQAPVPALVDTCAETLALVVGGAGSGHPIAPIGVRMTAREAAAVVRALPGRVLVATAEHAGLARAVADLTGRDLAILGVPRPAQRELLAAPDDIAAVLHTSGTTGAPKPVFMAQWRLAARVRVNGGLCELDQDSFYGAGSPFHHIGGLGNLAVALAAGATITGIPRFSVEGWMLLRELGVTHTSVVPSMLEMLLSAGQARQPHLRVLQYGGAPIRPRTLRQTYQALPGVQMLNMFGQTEGSPVSVLTPADHHEAVAGHLALLRSVGRAAPGVQLRFEDVDSAGRGEIWARADHLFRLDGEGWLHTGDAGWLDDAGYVHLAGRRSDMIIRGGENIHPLEVETVLVAHPGLADAAVVGVPDERLGQVAAAYLVAADPDAPPRAEELRAFARAQLSGFKVPVEWHFVAQLPRNTTGKVVRRRLVEGRDGPGPDGAGPDGAGGGNLAAVRSD